MFDIGWSELLVIGAVAVVAIGPKELPQVMRGLGRLMRRGQYLKYALSKQFDDFMREHELEEIRNLPKDAAIFDEEATDEGIHMLPIEDSHKKEGENRD